MKFKLAQVVGLNTDQQAAQVSSTARSEDNVFLGIAQLSCDDAFTRGRQLLLELTDIYFESEGSAADRLSTTFKAAKEKLVDVESSDLLLSTVFGKVLYLINNGKNAAYLKRGEKLSPLSQIGSPEQLISGFLQEGDKIFFATDSLTSFLDDQINSLLELPLSQWEDEVSAKIGMAGFDHDGMAGLLIKVEPDEPMEIPTISSENSAKRPEIKSKLSSLPILLTGLIKRGIEGVAGVSRFFPKSGRIKIFIALGLILVLSAGVGLQFKRAQDSKKSQEFASYVQQARDNFAAAQNLQTLNPEEAKNKLTAARTAVDQALALKPNDGEGLKLKASLEEGSSTILQQFSASQFPIFMDLDLIKKGFQAKNISLSVGKLLMLDPGSRTLVTVELASKSQQTLAGQEQLGEASLASLNGGTAFIYSDDKGIKKVDVGNKKDSVVAKKDKDWGTVGDIAGFAGNVYLLDKNGQVWKYMSGADGYSDKKEYLGKDSKVDLAGVIRMQIESSVYLLKQTGEMLRFTKGVADTFSYGGLDKGIKDPKSFFVSSDTDNLYLLDSGNSRLLVLGKTGEYKAQYQGDKFATATDLVVDEKGKKVYLLEGSKIYQVDLK